MRHTFLFQPAVWEARGHYVDRSGASVEVVGDATITHEDEGWMNRSLMRPVDPVGQAFESSYAVRPFEQGADTTTWTSSSAQLGKMSGQFVLVAESILSIGRTADGRYRSVEYLQQLSEDRYVSRGALLRGRDKVSSWAVELRRIR
jgi:hypothetical protein